MSGSEFYGLGLTLILIGLIIVVLAFVLFFAVSIKGEAKVKGGGAILIGPFPIVFGAGPGAQWLVLFAIILGVISVAVIYLMARKRL